MSHQRDNQGWKHAQYLRKITSKKTYIWLRVLKVYPIVIWLHCCWAYNESKCNDWGPNCFLHNDQKAEKREEQVVYQNSLQGCVHNDWLPLMFSFNHIPVMASVENQTFEEIPNLNCNISPIIFEKICDGTWMGRLR